MRTKLLIAITALALATGCQQSTNPRGPAAPETTSDPTPAVVPQTTQPGETTAEAIIADLRAHGFKVTKVTEADADLSGAKDNLDAHIDGVEAGILAFSTVEGTQGWAETSDSFGGIAVVGDTWAISLDSDSDDAKSRALGRRIVAAVGGALR